MSETPATPILAETHNLTRRYGKSIAIDHLTLQIPQGAIYGFIGPNGAGKTTTMRILTTLLLPTSGEARVAGYSVVKEPQKVRRVIGFMPDFFGVYDNMKSWEYLDFFAASYGVPASRRPRLISELLELVDLSHKRDAYVMGLSRGMKQRLSLARTMAHDPQLLILDEPASGLDPRARVELRELLRELRALGKTIMISSHILTELAEVCTHIGIIQNGQLLASGEVDDILRSLRSHHTYEVQLLSDAQQAAQLLQSVPGVAGVTVVPERIPATLTFDYTGDQEGLAVLLHQLVSNGVRVTNFAAQTSNLEDIFLQITEGQINAAAPTSESPAAMSG